MTARWALAFSAATVVALGGSAALRQAARRGRRGVRRRGGLVIAGGVLAGSLFLPELTGRVAIAVAGAVGLALFAAVAVTRSTGRGLRLLVLVVAALVAVAGGVRLEWTGVGVVDVAGTVALIAAVANGLRWLDGTDGLAAGLGAAIATAVFALAAFGDQGPLATLAAALVGASIGFLAYNAPPPSVYLNRDGALVIGYLAAVMAIEVQPSIDAPGSLAVVPMLVAVPVIEIIVVPLAQLRHRKRLTATRRDHLAHRLMALGLHRGGAFAVLVGAQLGLGALAVFVGRGVVDPVRGLAVAAAVVGVLVVACSKNVHGEKAPGFSARAKLVGFGAVGLLVVLAVPAGLAAARTRSSVDDARALVQRALEAARDGEAEVAREQFAAAAEEFESIRDTLENPFVSASVVVPVVGPNVRATRDLARIGADLARTGERTAAQVDQDRLEIVAGTVPLAEVERVTPDVADGARRLRRALERLERIDPTFLVEPVHDAIAEVDRELTAASREADNGVAAARLAPAVFGGDGNRRYFVAVQNPAEQRATGGFISSWGILTAQSGEVDLERFEQVRLLNPAAGEPRSLAAPDDYLARYARFQPERTWQNINMSPDFPTVAGVIADQYRQATGEQIDGVLAVDPAGLAALLELTGPVRVAPWPDPITADNVVGITLSEAYLAFEGQDDAREEFLTDLAETVVDQATEVELGSPAKIARVLGRAARDGHLILTFDSPRAQALVQELGVAGHVPEVRSDSLLMTTQNAGATKLDYYLRRHLDYSVRLAPDSDLREAQVRAHAEATFENTAPPSGLPRVVIGPYDDRFQPGENRSFVSVYTPLGLTAATFNGQEQPLESTTELDRNVYSEFLSIPAQSAPRLALDLTGTVTIDPDGWYTLEIIRQPAATPDTVTVTIEVPSGWRIADTKGLERQNSRRATAEIELDEDARLRVRLERDGGLWDDLQDG